MRIERIEVIGLRGATPQGGWTDELRPDDIVHTLVVVHTDEGADRGRQRLHRRRAGARRARRAGARSRSGENALEPERVSEKLHQHTFWLGRGGTLTHAISGIDIALWDILGQVTGQPVGRLLGGRYRERVRPYASLLMDEPEPLAGAAASDGRARLPRLQDRLGPVRPRSARRSTSRSCAPRARRSAPTRC